MPQSALQRNDSERENAHRRNSPLFKNQNAAMQQSIDLQAQQNFNRCIEP
jgi:hypothetical protein